MTDEKKMPIWCEDYDGVWAITYGAFRVNSITCIVKPAGDKFRCELVFGPYFSTMATDIWPSFIDTLVEAKEIGVQWIEDEAKIRLPKLFDDSGNGNKTPKFDEWATAK